ncbi:hypothetical protein [Arthrobacter sp. KK5.5]|uniref:hypothetical protein n=1 Tax=Arthrobacter sp. KK5.5 TaxID=3373084 RepID=UPI003EE77428
MKERPRSIVVLFAWTLISWLATGVVTAITVAVSAGSLIGVMTGDASGVRDASVYLVLISVLSIVTLVLTLATLFRAAAAIDWLVETQPVRSASTSTASMRTVAGTDR